MKKIIALFGFLLACVPAIAADSLNGAAQIRLTLVQGVPVTSADVTAAGSLFLEPYKGSQISVYDGVSTWVPLTIAPATTSLSAAGLAANTNYDVYLIQSAGVPHLAWSAAWANDTTPPDMAPTVPPTRALQDGVEVAASDHTKRIIGSIRVTSIAGQLEDSHSHRFVSNLYHDEPRRMHAEDPAATWPYSVGTAYQQAHNNAANQLDYITVVARPIWAHAQAEVMSSVGPAGAMVGIGLDGSLGNVALVNQQASMPASSNSYPTSATYGGNPGVGHHTVLWLEHGFGTGIQTWLGYIPPWQISGIIGEVSN